MSTNQLYVIPFFGIGRRVTLDVEFRYRGYTRHGDSKIIQYDSTWTTSPFGAFPELIDEWAATMIDRLKLADQCGFMLAGSPLTLKQLIRRLDGTRHLVGYGYGDRAASVGDFLEILHLCNVPN